MRLQKFMADCGVASRRKCEEYILSGKVAVNGQIVTQLGTQVDPEKDEVLYDGLKLTQPKERIYIMLYKPIRVMSTASDPEGRTTVLDLVQLPERLYPVGRLDYYTEGLILMTNDGDAAYHLLHPKYEVEKEYIAVIKNRIEHEEILKLQSGVIIDEVKTSPCKAKVVDITEHTTSISIIIHEGRNRQIRKMLESIDKEVLHLTRIRHGELQLTGLKSGEWRYLTPEEIKYLDGLK